MSTLEYTVSLLETMSEDKLKEVQKYIQYLNFKDMSGMSVELFGEDAIVRQLTESMKQSDMGGTTPASIVSRRMKEKYAI